MLLWKYLYPQHAWVLRLIPHSVSPRSIVMQPPTSTRVTTHNTVTFVIPQMPPLLLLGERERERGERHPPDAGSLVTSWTVYRYATHELPNDALAYHLMLISI